MALRISVEWLRELIELPEAPRELADILSLSGTEVDRVVELGRGWEGVVVARIASVDDVPGSDGLHVARLTVGDREVQVLSKAPNLRAGDLVPLATPGTRLPIGLEIKERKMMGLASQGMICSPVELGISEEAEGIMVLGTDGETGGPLSELMPPDAVLIVEPTPNRPDELCHLGIARELSAVLGRPMATRLASLQPPGDPPLQVEILDPDLCARYVARYVDGVKVGPSPDWLQRRLRAVGQKPISNVVDAANYVMLEMGQPLHAFDYDRLEGAANGAARIVVRRATAGESIACLDGRTRVPPAGTLLIADPRQPQAIAGIIGGAASAVSPSTTRLVIESANFLGTSIRQASRRLGLRTEASGRFEKQLHPALAVDGAARFAALVEDVAGGHAGGGLDDYPAPFENASITVSARHISDLLGEEVAEGEVSERLTALGFDVQGGGDTVVTRAPSHRRDVQVLVDVVEEIGRLRGYNSVPGTLPGRRLTALRILPPEDLEWRARDLISGAGFCEVINYPYASLHRGAPVKLGVFREATLRIANPMAADQDRLRTSLLGGLARSVERNAAAGNVGIRLFELGRVFWATVPGELPSEARILGLAIDVDAPARGLDAAVRRALLELIGCADDLASTMAGRSLEVVQADVPGFHPGRAGRVMLGAEVVGCVGQMGSELAAQFEIGRPLVLCEVNFDRVVATPFRPTYEPLARFPTVERDLALVVPETVPAAEVLRAARAAPEAILRRVEMYDEYRGSQVPPGSRGLTIKLVFGVADRTLRGEEASAAEARILDRLRTSVGAELRGEGG